MPTTTAIAVATRPTMIASSSVILTPVRSWDKHVLAVLGGPEQVRSARRVKRQVRRRVLVRGVVGGQGRADDGDEDEETQKDGADFRFGWEPPPHPEALALVRGSSGRAGTVLRHEGCHQVVLARARGSMST